MYSRILVAIDESPASGRALDHAIGLAKSLSATLRIIHVVDMGLLSLGPELAVNIDAITAARRASADKLLAAGLERARDAGIDAGTQRLETATPTQHVAAVIVEEAGQWPADLVVVGAHGRRGVERMLLGSVAEGVARRCTLPVLLVQQPETPA
ncbi:MAG: universal stress protein [Acidiferrobacteraceae bacterium]